MLKIMLISDMEKFLNKVNQCEGEVLLHLPDESVCSLKKDHTAVQMLRMMKDSHSELDLTLTEPRDYAIMLGYMMQAA